MGTTVGSHVDDRTTVWAEARARLAGLPGGAVITRDQATGVEIPEADLPAIRTIGDFASRLTAAA